ncbi:retropepsin-like aspartic protease family protein [Roseibium litorale]|uniref:TIGR02281 family clan AA aspartic protease n=1 Tax=Roseibium litorale TaxID=2803841 RepID=A0ABR9CNM9_9HYPH|nr:TIGR02281 family clan AA aspartic protease [Roseibium litorale]MBD8892338.1 TIGR02281 family clan AA aspartic protease [Roseibium litorale]
MWRYAIFIGLFLVIVPLVPQYFGNQSDGARFIRPKDDRSPGTKLDQQSERSGVGRRHVVQMSPNGAYITEARLNGRRLTMLIDTGASAVALPERDARSMGIFILPSDYRIPVKTANGVVSGASATVRDLELGDVRLKDIPALILPDRALSTPLLGMSALNRLSRFHFSNDTLILVQ